MPLMMIPEFKFGIRALCQVKALDWMIADRRRPGKLLILTFCLRLLYFKIIDKHWLSKLNDELYRAKHAAGGGILNEYRTT